jgi:hypothetical protein
MSEPNRCHFCDSEMDEWATLVYGLGPDQKITQTFPPGEPVPPELEEKGAFFRHACRTCYTEMTELQQERDTELRERGDDARNARRFIVTGCAWIALIFLLCGLLCLLIGPTK